MLFLYGCACLSFTDLLAYGYAVIMLNVLRYNITIKNSTIYYIYFCAQATRQFFVRERLEAQKAARGIPRVFSFCINIGKFWVVKDLFSDHLLARLL